MTNTFVPGIGSKEENRRDLGVKHSELTRKDIVLEGYFFGDKETDNIDSRKGQWGSR
jgi:hypothetical protein